jgi:hypothetical protein
MAGKDVIEGGVFMNCYFCKKKAVASITSNNGIVIWHYCKKHFLQNGGSNPKD